jgi:hypothetical protein
MIFRKKYFIWSVILFLIEVIIAVFIDDRFIRPYLGDFLVVIFLYCLIRAFFRLSVWQTSIDVLLFAYFVEWTQYFRLINILGWQKSLLAKVIIGSSFSWEDILAYTLGILTVLLVENNTLSKQQ